MALTQPRDLDAFYAASSPAGFASIATKGTAQPYVPERFHFEMSNGIVDVEQGNLELLVNTAPVQHGKTSLTSVWSSGWMFGLASHVARDRRDVYNTDFAEDKIGRPTRDILERHGPRFFGVQVDQNSRSMKRWSTTAGGGLLAVGVDKPVTGAAW